MLQQSMHEILIKPMKIAGTLYAVRACMSGCILLWQQDVCRDAYRTFLVVPMFLATLVAYLTCLHTLLYEYKNI